MEARHPLRSHAPLIVYMDVKSPYACMALEPTCQLEDTGVVEAMLDAAGAPVTGFNEYASGEGRILHDSLQDSLHPVGLFGVPSYVVDGQIFFGREHLPAVRWCLGGRDGPAADVAYGDW